MKNLLAALVLSIIANSMMFAQLEPGYLETLKKKPKSFILDILEQKKTNDEFNTYKHRRYEVVLDGFLMKSQVVFDTISNIAFNKRLEYSYDNPYDRNLIEIVQNNFDDELMKITKYTFDDRALLLIKEEKYDKYNEVLQTIAHDYGGCEDASVTNGLSKDISYTCASEDFTNRSSSRRTVKVFGDMGELVKELRYDKDGNLSVTETTTYNDDGTVASVNKETSSGSSYRTIYTYNEQGDRETTKASFVEFYYEYTYDQHGNWTTMIETTKVPSKRQVYNRTFIY